MKINKIMGDYIIFDNGFRLKTKHEQDCCENVYADFDVLINYNLSTVTGKMINIKDIEFDTDLNKMIQSVEDEGFNMVSSIGEKFFVPCYNEQNGYYNDDLELELYDNNNVLSETYDITKCTKYNYRP